MDPSPINPMSKGKWENERAGAKWDKSKDTAGSTDDVDTEMNVRQDKRGHVPSTCLDWNNHPFRYSKRASRPH